MARGECESYNWRTYRRGLSKPSGEGQAPGAQWVGWKPGSLGASSAVTAPFHPRVPVCTEGVMMGANPSAEAASEVRRSPLFLTCLPWSLGHRGDSPRHRVHQRAGPQALMLGEAAHKGVGRPVAALAPAVAAAGTLPRRLPPAAAVGAICSSPHPESWIRGLLLGASE